MVPNHFPLPLFLAKRIRRANRHLADHSFVIFVFPFFNIAHRGHVSIAVQHDVMVHRLKFPAHFHGRLPLPLHQYLGPAY